MTLKSTRGGKRPTRRKRNTQSLNVFGDAIRELLGLERLYTARKPDSRSGPGLPIYDEDDGNRRIHPRHTNFKR